MLNKFLIITLIFLLSSCTPADKVALQRTNINLNENTKHDNDQDVFIQILWDKTFPDNKNDILPLIANGKGLQIVTEKETHANVGIWNWDSLVDGVFNFLVKIEPVLKASGNAMGGGVGGTIISSVLLLLGGYVKYRRDMHEAEVKEVIAELQPKAEKDNFRDIKARAIQIVKDKKKKVKS